MEKTLSLVSVADTKIKETIQALKVSKDNVICDSVLLITSKDINRKLIFNGLKVIKIPPIKSFKEYNNFIIYELFKYIKSSHVLIIQWDGYIINSTKWDVKFLKYDYIGAPFIPRCNDEKYGKTLNGNFYSIGNGGFSLRSFKLLESPTKYKLRDNENITNNHEDGFFCVLHREFLEKQGLKWASFEIASEFAIESPISFKEFVNLPFGFHGKKMLLILRFIKPLHFLIARISNLLI